MHSHVFSIPVDWPGKGPSELCGLPRNNVCLIIIFYFNAFIIITII